MQKQTKPEPLGLSMAKKILIVAIIVSLGAVLGVAGWVVKNSPIVNPLSQILPVPEPTISNSKNLDFYQIHELKQNKAIVGGNFITEGYVVKIYTCPPCPKGHACKACMGHNIVISENNNLLDTYLLTDKELIIFTDNPNKFKLNKKYRFSIEVLDYKSTSQSLNNIKLVEYEAILKDETADWKTYRNEEYGYEMKYPEDWFTFEDTRGRNFSLSKFSGHPEKITKPVISIIASKTETGGHGLEGCTQKSSDNIIISSVPVKQIMFQCSNSIVAVADFSRNDLNYKILGYLENSQEDIFNQILSTFKFTEKDETAKCSSIDIPNYEVAKNNNGNLLEFYVDLNGDQKEEFVRVYREFTNTGERALPIMVKIFSGQEECQKEEFSYEGVNEKGELFDNQNEVYLAEVMPNFWGDGKNAVTVGGVSTGYGSGSIVTLRFFTHQNGEYEIINGPQFGGHNWQCCKFDDNIPGQEIIGAESRWAEDYSDYCAGCPSRFQFFIYTWNGKEYIKTEAGITENKYSGNIDDILQKELSVLEEVE